MSDARRRVHSTAYLRSRSSDNTTSKPLPTSPEVFSTTTTDGNRLSIASSIHHHIPLRAPSSPAPLGLA